MAESEIERIRAERDALREQLERADKQVMALAAALARVSKANVKLGTDTDMWLRNAIDGP